MNTARRLRHLLLCILAVPAASLLSGCSGTHGAWLPVAATVAPNKTIDTARKVYNLQQKLRALNFTVRSDPAGGQFAFIATKEVKTVPLSLNVDLAQSPMTRAVSVAGVPVPLQGGGPVAFDAQLRATLAGSGVPPMSIGDVETQLNAALEAINSLGA